MTPEEIIGRAAAEGVRITRAAAGRVKVNGPAAAVDRWLPAIRECKPEILSCLAGDDLFNFAPPNDPEGESEALAERVAIMMQSNAWDEATALREARWDVERDLTWRVFLRNAGAILGAPIHERLALLDRYAEEARSRYGEPTGSHMVLTMQNWIEARAERTAEAAEPTT